MLIFIKSMPHYGLGNTSEGFRLSLDIRAVRRSSSLPVVGRVTAIADDSVTVEQDDEEVTLRLDDETFVRGQLVGSANPVPITRAQAPERLPPGTSVMATGAGDRALLLRPTI